MRQYRYARGRPAVLHKNGSYQSPESKFLRRRPTSHTALLLNGLLPFLPYIPESGGTRANMATAVMDSTDETFMADGAPLCSEEGLEDEEVLAEDNKAVDEFEAILGELEVLMMDEALNERIDEFTRKHCDVFVVGDENKLEYTQLFSEYTSMIETFIENQLGASLASFDMASFCQTLQEKAKSDEGLLDHPALEMLSAYSDFNAFKELMLSARAGADAEALGGLMCVSGDKLGLSGVGGTMSGSALAEEEADDGTGEAGFDAPDLDGLLSIAPVKGK